MDLKQLFGIGRKRFNMQAALDTYPVIDGFVFSTKLRCDLQFRQAAVEQYERLRRAKTYRQMQWLIPRGPVGVTDVEGAATIPAYDSYEKQVQVGAGSVIWGYSFVGITGGEHTPQTLNPGSMSFEVRDACDDIPLFSEICTRLYAVQNPITPSPGFNQVPQQYLAKLLIVGPPGLLNVVIANTYNTTQLAQLVLFGGQPV
jgi:hypothetical protein